MSHSVFVPAGKLFSYIGGAFVLATIPVFVVPRIANRCARCPSHRLQLQHQRPWTESERGWRTEVATLPDARSRAPALGACSAARRQLLLSAVLCSQPRPRPPPSLRALAAINPTARGAAAMLAAREALWLSFLRCCMAC
jgi:hypothetical protein